MAKQERRRFGTPHDHENTPVGRARFCLGRDGADTVEGDRGKTRTKVITLLLPCMSPHSEAILVRFFTLLLLEMLAFLWLQNPTVPSSAAR